VSQLRFTPHPAPSPLPGARGARALLTPSNPHQSPLSPIGGEGGGEGAIPLPTPPQRLQDTANPASSRTVHAACLSCVSPLTPAPSPLPGARGARAPLTPPNPHQSPLPHRGEGSVVRGQSPFQPLLNAPETPRMQHPRRTCPCGVSQLRFTPHPRQDTANPASSRTVHAACLSCVSPLTPAPSPLPGARGALRTFNTLKPTPIPPLPGGGEGWVVRGNPPSNPSSTPPGHRECSILAHCRCSESQLRFTPHPRPSPLPGARGARAPLTPPNPHQSPSPPVGERGRW
jgi:hypothetical protein